MKRIIALFLSCVLLLTCFGVVSAEEEKVKLKALFCANQLTKSPEDMKWIAEIEEAAGVDVEWEVIYTDWGQIKSTRFASGDIPDLLFNAAGNSDYTTYDGLFMELTDLIAENAPNITAMFEEEPDTLAVARTMEGSIYAIPKFQGKWPDTASVFFINKVWLDNLGLEVPETLTELRNVLAAFRDEDANGNGDPTDEVPLDWSGWFGGAFSASQLIGSWGIQLVNNGGEAYFAEDGIIKNFAVDERYKEMMIFLSELYAEGMINENVITNDYSAFQSLSRGDMNGDALVGAVLGWEETDKFGMELAEQYIACGPFLNDLEGSKYAGVPARWPYDFAGMNLDGNRVCMSAKCSNPAAAMRFVDQFYRPDVSVQVLFGGITDGCVSVVGEDHYKVEPPLVADQDPGTWKWTNAFADWGPMYIRRATQLDMPMDMDNALREREQYKDAISLINMETEYYPQNFMKYSAEDQNKLAMLSSNVWSVMDSYWALWLTGESDIEDDWDDYVAAMKDAGLEEVLAIRQAAYDAYCGK